MLKYQIKGN
jgi:hypothetical protein